MKYKLVALVFLSAVFFLFGCYSEKKAQQQVDRATVSYPLMLAKKARDLFPCITKDSVVEKIISDSAAYNEVIEDLQSELFASFQLQDSLIKALATGDTSCVKYASVVMQLQQQNRVLKFQLQNIPPIHDTIRITKKTMDSAAVALANNEALKERIQKDRLQSKLDAVNEAYANDKAKWKGKVGVPWWVFVLIAGAAVLRFRKSIFSILKN